VCYYGLCDNTYTSGPENGSGETDVRRDGRFAFAVVVTAENIVGRRIIIDARGHPNKRSRLNDYETYVVTDG